MKTPEKYRRLVNKGIITPEIAADVIYSLNKRAKNWRDNNPEKYSRIRKERIEEGTVHESGKDYPVLEYYREKDFIILSLFTPEKIHLIDGIEYLFYRVNRSIFHLPCYVYTSYGYSIPRGLAIEKGESFPTPGEDTDKLLSLQFCRRVIQLIRSGNFVFTDETKAGENKK